MQNKLKQLSPEDREVVRKGEILRSLIEGEGWQLAKEVLDNKINVIKHVTTIDMKRDISEIGKEAYARASAISLIEDWFNDISDMVSNYYDIIEIENAENNQEEQIVREL